jgi:ATP-dependent Clp protease ATP-binding subunit ClpA
MLLRLPKSSNLKSSDRTRYVTTFPDRSAAGWPFSSAVSRSACSSSRGPGVGKTYLGKVLAKELARPIVHIDMTQFASSGHAATSLFGSPKGYIGSDSYGKLTSALRDKPNALVLLDEFEKAHSNVHKNFLTAWNDGFITEASNERHISTTSAIFVLTTNAALEAMLQISKDCVGKPDDLRRNADAALRAAGFAPEVLSRIDRIFVFNPLQDLDVARVAALESKR